MGLGFVLIVVVILFLRLRIGGVGLPHLGDPRPRLTEQLQGDAHLDADLEIIPTDNAHGVDRDMVVSRQPLQVGDPTAENSPLLRHVTTLLLAGANDVSGSIVIAAGPFSCDGTGG